MVTSNLLKFELLEKEADGAQYAPIRRPVRDHVQPRATSCLFKMLQKSRQTQGDVVLKNGLQFLRPADSSDCCQD